MPTETLVVVVVVIAAFAVFSATLLYAERATRNSRQDGNRP